MYCVNEAACTGCGDCVEACPAGAISIVGGLAQIDQAVCADCGSCAAACPRGAITMAVAICPAYVAITPVKSLSPVVPSTSAIEISIYAYRPEAELLPAQPRRSRLWPMIGDGIVWAVRELLPAFLQAWRESPGRVEVGARSGRYPAGRAGESAGRRRNRRQYGRGSAARSQPGSGSPNRNRC